MADQPPTQVSSSDTKPPNAGRLVGEHARALSGGEDESTSSNLLGCGAERGPESTPVVSPPESSLSDAPSGAVVPHTQLDEGETCETCGHTKPFKRKTTSPTSKTRAYKVPVDELEAHNEILDAAAEHIGAKGLPFAAFKTVTAALAVLLQDEGAKGLHG